MNGYLNSGADFQMWLEILGWTLLHFVWQGALVWSLVVLMINGFNSMGAQMRYRVLLAGLVVMIGSPIATAIYLAAAVAPASSEMSRLPTISGPDPALATSSTVRGSRDLLADPQSLAVENSSGSHVEPLSAWKMGRLSVAIQRHMGWLVWSWLAGVVLLHFRLGCGLWQVFHWRLRSRLVRSKSVLGYFESVKRRLGVGSSIRLYHSSGVRVPIVLGWVKPIVIVPSALITGMTTAELESIFAHELAHLRRNDHWVNLLQVFAEKFLFYHPAVWTVSRQLRIEREFCCDDAALLICSDRLVLVQALAKLEEFRSLSNQLAMASSGGALMTRLRRIISGSDAVSRRRLANVVPPIAVAGFVALAIAMSANAGGTNRTVASYLPEGESKVGHADPPGEFNNASSQQPEMVVSSSPSQNFDPARYRSQDVTAISTHVYPDTRSSKYWIPRDSGPVPVDQGVTFNGKTFYLSFFYDLIAVTEQTNQIIWTVDWKKKEPFWKSISIVMQDVGGSTRRFVELAAPASLHGEAVYRYFDPGTGEPCELDQAEVDESPNPLPRIKVQSRDNDTIIRALAMATKDGRRPADLVRHFSPHLKRLGGPNSGVSITDMESIVSARPVNSDGNKMRATEVYFNLPEGSGTRATFVGDRIQIVEMDGFKRIQIESGQVDLLDSVGVLRARAVPDKGEKLIVDCRLDLDEFVMKIRSSEGDDSMVSVSMNTESGAPKDERDPPHGSIRYEIFPADDDQKPVRLKMKWRYELIRLITEAEQEAGKSWQELIELDSNDNGEGAMDNAAPGNAAIKVATDQAPWVVNGQVNDDQGRPMKGVAVRAHTGIGTLRMTGSAVTNVDGKYEFRFGPAVWMEGNRGVQAATISVAYPGYFEKNLHRQGDLVGAHMRPEGEIGWGGKTDEQLFLPNQPKTIDFVMAPATRIRGKVTTADGKPANNFRISLTGDELPPSSSVVAQTRTDPEGNFELANLPTGYAFQFLVELPKAESPWLAWASGPIQLEKSSSRNRTKFSVSSGGKQTTIEVSRIEWQLRGVGVNWQQALKAARSQPVEAQSDLNHSQPTVTLTLGVASDQ
jgi:beta-lactamase regulating signal transducer with metallopeptidase domain